MVRSPTQNHKTPLRQMSDPFDPLPRVVYKPPGCKSTPPYDQHRMHYPRISTRFVTDAKEAANQIVDTLYPNMEHNVKVKTIDTFIHNGLTRFGICHKAEMQVMDQMKRARTHSPDAHHIISRTSSSMRNTVTATSASPDLSLSTNAEQDAVKSLLNMW